jgi:hypothetical protein
MGLNGCKANKISREREREAKNEELETIYDDERKNE